MSVAVISRCRMGRGNFAGIGTDLDHIARKEPAAEDPSHTDPGYQDPSCPIAPTDPLTSALT